MRDQVNNSLYSLDRIPGQEKVNDWSLVLYAMGIPHKVISLQSGWIIRVKDRYRKEAEHQIELFEKENSPSSPEENIEKDTLIKYLPLLFSFLLIGFHIFINTRANYRQFLESGCMSGDIIRKYQLWRGVTALTIHIDLTHLFSNIIFGSLIIASVQRQIGKGFGWLMILFASFAGNFLNGLLHSVLFKSIGASAAVFIALGILTSIQFIKKIREKTRQSWMPLLAAAALLGLLSQGKYIDLMGHFLGLFTGLIFGIILALYIIFWKLPGEKLQGFFSLFSLSIVIFCWLIAINII